MQFLNDPRNSERDCHCYLGYIGDKTVYQNIEVLIKLLRETGRKIRIRTGKTSKWWDLGYYDTLIISVDQRSCIEIVFGSSIIGPGPERVQIFGYDIRKEVAEILNLFDGFYYPERTWSR